MTQVTSRQRRIRRGSDSGPEHVNLLIIGAGFAGLGAAIRLAQQGRRDFIVVERGDEVGGTWRDNTYPGAACDVPSHLYSYSFELNPGWTRSFSPQPEIQDYLVRTARKYGVHDHLRLGTDVLEAKWDTDAALWRVRTTAGDLTANVLAPAVGALAEPALPDIPGISEFTGQVFHSARWDHSADLTGKRVAVIGTGASAIQIVPAIVDSVGHLDVYQRTAPWVMPRHDRAYPALEKAAYRHVPGLQRLAREAIYWGREWYVLGFAFQPKILRAAQRIAARNISKAIADPELRRRVTPDWQIGCKRILISNEWYPALARKHVDLVTDPIREVRPNGIVTADGVEREVDAIVVATGFHVTDSPAYDRIVGANGVSLGEHWRRHGQRAYKGATVHGFPNMIFLIGPNMGLGHSSMVYMAESAINYLDSALQTVERHAIATFDVREDVQDSYNDRIQRRMKHTIWTRGGCASWYLDQNGNNTTLWPSFTFLFRRMTKHFDLAAYDTTARADRVAEPATEAEFVSA